MFDKPSCRRGLANLQRLRSEATSAPVPPVGGVGCSRGDTKIEGPHCSVGVWIHGHIREVMRQKKAKTLKAPSPDLSNVECTQLVSPEEVSVPRNPSEKCQTTRAVNSLRDARYGLRGVRVGEASHPGPPELMVRLGVDSWSEVPLVVASVGAATTRDSGTASVCPRCRRLRLGSGFTTSVDTPAHRANRLSPFTVEVHVELLSGHLTHRWVSQTQAASSSMPSNPHSCRQRQLRRN